MLRVLKRANNWPTGSRRQYLKPIVLKLSPKLILFLFIYFTHNIYMMSFWAASEFIDITIYHIAEATSVNSAFDYFKMPT